ncbi:MAG: nucleoside-triphosphatase [Candidatus Thorarchaeota archaeon]
MNLLLTGKPSVGKSTIIKKVVGMIGYDNANGFWTEEMRIESQRVGFVIRTMDGTEAILAHIEERDGPQVGKYGVFIRHIDDVIIPALQRARNSEAIIIIDEIASMELKSPKFAIEVRKCLDTGRVLGTLQLRKAQFQDEVRSRSDVRIIVVTLENRNSPCSGC